MFDLPRLPIPRQRNVGQAVEAIFRVKNSYKPEITRLAKAVILATGNLGSDDDAEAGLFTIDVATDGVVSAIYRVEQDIQKGLTATVVPLGPEQQAMLDAAVLLDEVWFPNGIGFIRDSAGLQHATMVKMRAALSEPKKGPKLEAAIKRLGLKPLCDHFLSHIPLYTRALGLAGEAVSEEQAGEPLDPTDVWHAAYVKLALAVSTIYEDDAAKRETLLGAYKSELAAYRADMAKERKRARAAEAKAEKEAEAKKKGG